MQHEAHRPHPAGGGAATETQPDLREAPYRVGRRVPRNVYFEFEPLFMAATAEQARKLTDVLNVGHAALAQVSALQAEVEEVRRDMALMLVGDDEQAEVRQKYFDRVLNRAKIAEAEVERLQKVEGERGRLERDPCGSGSRPADQAPAGLGPAGFDPSRDVPPTHISIEGIEGLFRHLAQHTDTEAQDRTLFAEASVRLREYHPEAQQIIAGTRGRWEAFSELDCDSDPSIDPLAGYSVEWLVGWWRNGAQEADLNIHVGSDKNAERQARSMAGSLNYLLSMQNAPAEPAPCDRSGEAGETSGLDPQGESTVTGAARQAPSDNPLTETKEGSEHV